MTCPHDCYPGRPGDCDGSCQHPEPAPAATDTGLETVLWGNERSLSQPHDPVVWERVTASYPRPYYNVELVRRSQADELLAERDVVIETQANSIDTLERKVQHWQNKHDALEAKLTAAEKALEARETIINDLVKHVDALPDDAEFVGPGARWAALLALKLGEASRTLRKKS